MHQSSYRCYCNCCQHITLFISITMLCGIDSILRNILHIQYEYFLEYCESHKTLLWICMAEGGGNTFSSTPTLLPPWVCYDNSSLVKEGSSTSILMHIGFIKEEDLEVFVDAFNDRFAPTLPSPSNSKYKRTLALLPSNTLFSPNWSWRSMEALILAGGIHWELN